MKYRLYLAQARFAAEVCGADIDFRRLSVYDVATLGRRFDRVLFMRVLYHLRHPFLALDLLHEHAAGDLFVFQTRRCAAAVPKVRRRRRITPLARRGSSMSPLSPDVLHRKKIRGRSDAVGEHLLPLRLFLDANLPSKKASFPASLDL